MDLIKLKREAERQVALKYDAWANMDGAERESIIRQEMLRLLLDRDSDIFRAALLVSREAWETGAWSWLGHDRFSEWICEVGGKYANQDTGEPSGSAYDLAAYVSFVWDVLEKRGVNPVELAVHHWSKARQMIPPIRRSVKMIAETGEETKKPEEAKEIKVADHDTIKRVTKSAIDDSISMREMRDEFCERRVNKFIAKTRLQGDGTWAVKMHLTDKQWGLMQRLLSRHMEVRLE